MSLSRIKTWIAGEVLTASDLNGEFNNIVTYVNALAFNTSMGEGSPTAPSLSFAGDSDTGIYRPFANQVGLTGGGTTAFVASGYANATNYLMAVPGITTQPAVLTASGGDTNIALLLKGRGTGYVQASSFVFENFAATQSPTITGRAYWQSTEGSLHISAGTIARVPAITGLTAGDLIVATDATIYARLAIGPASSYLKVATAGGSLVYGSTKARLSFADAASLATGTTRFVGPWADSASETDAFVRHVIPYNGRIRNLYVLLTTAPGASQDIKVTVRVNSASAFSTLTISGAAVSGSLTTESFPVNPGDYITFQCTSSAAATGTTLAGALELDCP